VAHPARTEHTPGSPGVMLPHRTRRELEATLGVTSIEAVIARRMVLVREHAALAARVKLFEPRRKRMLALIVTDLHNSYAKGGAREGERRPAADVVRDMARLDPRYAAFLAGAEEDLARWAMVEAQLRSLEELVNRDQRLIGFATAEVGRFA
jgi:hypothetical protein